MERQAQLEELARLVKRAIQSTEAWDWAKSVDADPFIDIERQIDLLEKSKPKRKFHYLIISPYFDDAVGCTNDMEYALTENPNAKFRRIAKSKCPICNIRQN